MTEPEPTKAVTPEPSEPKRGPGGRKELQLDLALHARMLEQMHEEQATALRKREIINWVLLPCAIGSLVVGTVLMFSENMMIAFVANTVATGIAWVLWKVNRERIRDFLGM